MPKMTYLIGTIVVVAFVLVLSPFTMAGEPKSPLDIDKMVEALRMCEAWDGRSRGASAERGPWQITPGVWHQYSHMPFFSGEGTSMQERSEQRRVAREQVYWITQRLANANVKCDPYNVALVWNAGWASFFYGSPHKPSARKRDYAKRATNLYHSIQ